MIFNVDPEKCIRCNACSQECPISIIEATGEDHLPGIPDEKTEKCINCGHCMAFCPTGALRLTASSTVKTSPSDRISPEILGAYLKNRRSIRSYRTEPVDKQVLKNVFDIARYAASGGNGQPVQWIVINNPDEIKRLSGMVIDWFKDQSRENPFNKKRVNDFISNWDQGVDRICLGAPHLIIAHIPEGGRTDAEDAIIALTHIDIIAPSFGLGTCWAGLLSIAARYWDPLREGLGIPKGRVFSYAMMIGYPRFKPHHIPERKKADIEWRD